ncbi:hypothetical protein D3C71_1658270 [compost metagenome]
MQLRRIRVLLNGLDEGVDGLVLLLVEQKIQSLEVGLGCAAVFGAQLAQVKARSDPAKDKRYRQAQKNPGQVKFHGLKAGLEGEG